MKKKMNNKGFSLVELIVVMAIMAILAVTLAPRLMQYVDKARQTNDRELVNTIYTAVQYSMIDPKLYKDVHDTTAIDSTPHTAKAGSTRKSGDIYTTTINLKGGATSTVGVNDDPYDVSNDGETWTRQNDMNSNKFMKAVLDVIDDFKLQSELVTANAQIIITIVNDDYFTVTLDYDDTDGAYDYELDSSSAS